MYRHWDGKLELVADAVSRLKHSVQPPDTDDHRQRIAGMLRGIAEMLAGSRFAACVPAVISAAQRDEGLRDFHHSSSAERRAFMVGMLDAARDAGHLDQSIDTNLLAELLVAPIFFRRLMTPQPFPVDRGRPAVGTSARPALALSSGDAADWCSPRHCLGVGHPVH